MSSLPLACVECAGRRCDCPSTVGTRRVVRVTAGRPPDLGEQTDAEIGLGLSAGDERCLEEAYRRWSTLIYTLALRALGSTAEAEDVAQQTFVGGWRSRADFRPQAGTLPGWLVGIAKHRILDRQRARSRELRLVGAVEQAGTGDRSEPLESLIDELVLAEEIRQLPPPRGTILRLAF